jgi:phage terminase large subunit GpA-like protein
MVAIAQLEEQIDAKFSVEEVSSVLDHLEKVLYLPSGEKEGFIRFAETPWAREPIDSLVDPEVTVEAGIYGTQMAKTTQATCVAVAANSRLRKEFVWMWPKEGAARKFSRSRFQPIINASPELRKLKPDNLDLWTNLELHYRNGAIGFFVGSHSAIDQKSSSVPLVIVDEIEDIAAATEKETDPITSINERSKTFTDRKLFLFGSPLLEIGPAWQQYLLGDQRHFFVPCPDCGTMQTLEFRGLVWVLNRATGALEQRGAPGEFRVWWDPASRLGEHEWDYDAVRASTVYVCPECGAHIRDQHKRAMLASARWHPTAKARIYGHRSRRINSLYPLWASTTFPNFAIEFLNSRVSAKKLQNFTNNWEARAWTTGLDITDKTALAKRLAYLVSELAEGARVSDTSLLLVDVQRHHLVLGLFNFDGRGDVHLVSCRYARDFAELEKIDDELAPTFGAMDARYRAQEAYEFVHSRRGRWVALRGDETGSPLSPNFKFDPFTGDKQGRQGLYVITLVHLNTYTWGEDFLNRLYPAKQIEAELPGAQPPKPHAGPFAPEPAAPVILAADGAPAVDPEAPRIRDFHVFATFPKRHDFVKQLFSEYLIEYVDAKGRPQRKWKESPNNHLFDLCKYAYAIGSFLGLTRIAADTARAVESARAAAAAEQAKQQQLDLTQPRGGSNLFRG